MPKKLDVTLSFEASGKIKIEVFFCFSALFKSGLFFERNTHAEMGKGNAVSGQSLISIKQPLPLDTLVLWWKDLNMCSGEMSLPGDVRIYLCI